MEELEGDINEHKPPAVGVLTQIALQLKNQPTSEQVSVGESTYFYGEPDSHPQTMPVSEY